MGKSHLPGAPCTAALPLGMAAGVPPLPKTCCPLEANSSTGCCQTAKFVISSHAILHLLCNSFSTYKHCFPHCNHDSLTGLILLLQPCSYSGMFTIFYTFQIWCMPTQAFCSLKLVSPLILKSTYLLLKLSFQYVLLSGTSRQKHDFITC